MLLAKFLDIQIQTLILGS